MLFSKKENSLLEIFLLNKKVITAQDIAEDLKISTKTVYRLVKKINSFSEDGFVIESQTGKGLKLNYKNYLKLINKIEISRESHVERRYNRILLELLFKSPNLINLISLYEGQFISNDLMLKDIEKMKEITGKYDLRLIKKNNKVSVIGSEKNIRKLSYQLISTESFLKTDTYSVNDSNINTYDADFITSLLESIEKDIGSTIPYPYNINIFSHIYILISRFRQGRIQGFEGKDKELHFDDEEQLLIKKNEDKYIIARKIIKRIDDYLVTELSEIEVFYLFQYIVSSRLSKNNQNSKNINDYEKAKNFSLYLASFLKKETGLSFIEIIEDKEFLEHLRLMMYRNDNGIIIKNELINDIKREYASLYTAIEKAVQEVSSEYEYISNSKDEIGFLVIYFAKILENKKFQKRVLIMCSSGVGTSELLKVKVLRAFPNLDIVDVVSFNQYKKKYEKKGTESFDFILTTINFENKSNVPSLLMNFMFTKLDKENVTKLLEGL